MNKKKTIITILVLAGITILGILLFYCADKGKDSSKKNDDKKIIIDNEKSEDDKPENQQDKSSTQDEQTENDMPEIIVDEEAYENSQSQDDADSTPVKVDGDKDAVTDEKDDESEAIILPDVEIEYND